MGGILISPDVLAFLPVGSPFCRVLYFFPLFLDGKGNAMRASIKSFPELAHKQNHTAKVSSTCIHNMHKHTPNFDFFSPTHAHTTARRSNIHVYRLFSALCKPNLAFSLSCSLPSLSYATESIPYIDYIVSALPAFPFSFCKRARNHFLLLLLLRYEGFETRKS